MLFERCRFDTERLHVAEWHTGSHLGPPDGLPARVAAVLTAVTTQFLPPGWQGDYSEDRARTWIAERDAESPTLLVTNRVNGETVGLVLLFAEPRADEPKLVDARLGYVIAEAQWGQGLASELVRGLVTWCRGEPAVASLTGGVEASNPASARVLTKNGFKLVEGAQDAGGDSNGGDELMYRLDLS